PRAALPFPRREARQACPRARGLDPGIGGVGPVILLASLAVGLVAYLAVGLLTGSLPRAGTRVQVPRRGRIERQTWLLQAGTELSVAQFVVGSLAAGALSFALVAAITGSPVVAIVPAAALGFLPRAYFGHRRAPAFGVATGMAGRDPP